MEILRFVGDVAAYFTELDDKQFIARLAVSGTNFKRFIGPLPSIEAGCEHIQLALDLRDALAGNVVSARSNMAQLRALVKLGHKLLPTLDGAHAAIVYATSKSSVVVDTGIRFDTVEQARAAIVEAST